MKYTIFLMLLCIEIYNVVTAATRCTCPTYAQRGFVSYRKGKFIKKFHAATYFDAVRACEKLGTRLVTIKTVSELELLIKTVGSGAASWIGIYRESINHPWINLDKTRFSDATTSINYISFNTTNYIPGCMYLYGTTIRNGNCGTSYSYICEYDPTLKVPWPNSVRQLAATWEAAELKCQLAGGHLMMIKSLEDQRKMESLTISGVNYWLGMEDINGDGTMLYVDGSGELNDGAYKNWSNDSFQGVEESYCAYFSGTDKLWHTTSNCAKTTSYPSFCTFDTRCSP